MRGTLSGRRCGAKATWHLTSLHDLMLSPTELARRVLHCNVHRLGIFGYTGWVGLRRRFELLQGVNLLCIQLSGDVLLFYTPDAPSVSRSVSVPSTQAKLVFSYYSYFFMRFA